MWKQGIGYRFEAAILLLLAVTIIQCGPARAHHSGTLSTVCSFSSPAWARKGGSECDHTMVQSGVWGHRNHLHISMSSSSSLSSWIPSSCSMSRMLSLWEAHHHQKAKSSRPWPSYPKYGTQGKCFNAWQHQENTQIKFRVPANPSAQYPCNKNDAIEWIADPKYGGSCVFVGRYWSEERSVPI